MPLYAFIYIYIICLFFSITYYSHLLMLFYCLLYYILLIYLLPKVSYIYFTYRIRARGVGWLGRFSEIVGAFSGVGAGSIRQTVVLWIVGGRLGRFACVFVRVVPCVRACGGMPPPFFARAQSLGVYPLIVYGG